MFPEQTDEVNYWNAAGFAGLTFGLLVFALSIIGGYMTIGAEPSGDLIGPSMITGFLSCLIGAFGGMMAIKVYVNQLNEPLKMGRGAMIGFFTGIVVALISTVFSLFWNIIDPDFTQNLVEASIANIEEMNIPEAQKEDMIDTVAAQTQQMQTPGGIALAFLMSSLLYGMLNMLTGILGVKFFSPKEDEI